MLGLVVFKVRHVDEELQDFQVWFFDAAVHIEAPLIKVCPCCVWVLLAVYFAGGQATFQRRPSFTTTCDVHGPSKVHLVPRNGRYFMFFSGYLSRYTSINNSSRTFLADWEKNCCQ